MSTDRGARPSEPLGAPAIIAAGAALANPGVFMLLAAKTISQLGPSTAQYVLDWALFAIVALLPLAVALLMLPVAPGFTEPRLITARGFVERQARTIIASAGRDRPEGFSTPASWSRS